MKEKIIETKAVSCRRGDHFVLNQLTFTVQSGEIWQILGPNGSGKTSLLRLLAGLLEPEAGKVFHSSHKIAYLGHKLALKENLTAAENLCFDFSGQTYTADQVEAALDLVGLVEFADLWAGRLSQGQRQRLAIARLWLSNPFLWLLDEPFSALDQASIQAIQELFHKKLQEGGAIVLTTHRPLTLDSLPLHTWLLKDQAVFSAVEGGRNE